ncbi:MAG: DeoR/GlpR family DNA-binding transcription regulator [Bifidobacteriaceae bacterium]|jgi:DeoR/GlpR family transcriptional regulator of sugar metabolism|nr:DeoR/GlpR family DNA-binding transcription regulator [Bifidobacteriaceae bacterium]
MFALERQAKIAALVASERRAAVPAIAEQFDVSEATVRRDLVVLERAGKLKRTHGGAVHVGVLAREISIDVRSRANAEAKDVIGRLAAQLVDPDDTIMLDAATTTLAMVGHLQGVANLRAVTSGVRTAQALGAVPGAGVYLCGGELRASTLSITGHQAEEFVRSYYADKLFLSARAISAEAGIMDFSEADARIKQTMIERSATKVLLVDSSKFDARAFIQIARLDQVDLLVTDKRPDAALAAALDAAGVKVVAPTG